jgi:aminobenzoyl-glutamate utilization protein A
MHACGHDGHAAMGLGVAQVLMELRDRLHGTVKLIFQPAEEGVRGAKSIVDKGHLDGVDYLLASHIQPDNDLEPVPVYPGAYGSLATCKYDVTFRGLAAHAGASPHAGKNALLAAAAAVLNLNAIPRHREGTTRVNVGTLRAGSGRNVIPDEAFMEIELRGETTALNQYMCDNARRILESAAAMYQCDCEIKLVGAADSLSSDEALCLRIRDVAAALGMPVSETLMLRSGGSEDVSYMMNRVQEQGGQATFMRLVTRVTGGSHNRRFDFGEEALSNVVKIF